MGKHKIEGKNYYLRVTEPVKFIDTLIKNIQRSKENGFKIKIMFGGPEKFPTHIFNETDLYSKKIILLIYSISYWTHIALDVKGATEEENQKEIDNILNGLEEEVAPF